MSDAYPIFVYLGLGYLIGSIPFSQLLAYWRTGADLRKDGYRNVGAYNVVNMAGISWGLLAGFLDMGKGMAVLAMAGLMAVEHPWDQLMGLCAILGHNYPLWLSFKGGKGVMVMAGLFFWLAPLETILAVVTSFILFWRFRFVNVSVVGGVVVFITVTLGFDHFAGIQLLVYGAVALIMLTYMPRFWRWLSLQRI
ncbi:MAG: glycerol-3-phosphate acyltransferase [Desulfobacteraceae bacterium]|jgi:glycerol-3-phosphate acyltransferase PlsY